MQLLVDYYPEDLKSELFICPGSDVETQAATDADGKFVLTSGNCSYEGVPWRLRTKEGNAIWLYDKAQNHPRGRNVALADGKVYFMDEESFQKRLSEERKRFGASE